MNSRIASALTAIAVLVLAGCSANPMRQYDTELKETVQLVKNGSVKQALDLLGMR